MLRFLGHIPWSLTLVLNCKAALMFFSHVTQSHLLQELFLQFSYQQAEEQFVHKHFFLSSSPFLLFFFLHLNSSSSSQDYIRKEGYLPKTGASFYSQNSLKVYILFWNINCFHLFRNANVPWLAEPWSSAVLKQMFL